MNTKYALANTYALKWNNSSCKSDIPKDDILLNKYDDLKNETFLFKDGSFLVGEKGTYTSILPKLPMELTVKKNSLDNHYLQITYSRSGGDDFKDDVFSQRHLIIFEDGSGHTMTGDNTFGEKEELHELEMGKLTNQIGLRLDLIKSSLGFLNDQGTELKNILLNKTTKKKKNKKSKDKKNHP